MCEEPASSGSSGLCVAILHHDEQRFSQIVTGEQAGGACLPWSASFGGVSVGFYLQCVTDPDEELAPRVATARGELLPANPPVDAPVGDLSVEEHLEFADGEERVAVEGALVAHETTVDRCLICWVGWANGAYGETMGG